MKRVDKRSNDSKEDLRNFKKNGSFYIYGEFDETIPINILAPLQSTIDKRLTTNDGTPIKVFINSQGGLLDYAYELVGLFEYSKSKRIPIHTYVLSSAFSAASIVAVAGSVRFATKRTAHLIHYPRGADYSDTPEMAMRNTKWYEFISNEMVAHYEKYCSIPDLRNKLMIDNYLVFGKELTKYKMIDKYYE